MNGICSKCHEDITPAQHMSDEVHFIGDAGDVEVHAECCDADDCKSEVPAQ